MMFVENHMHLNTVFNDICLFTLETIFKTVYVATQRIKFIAVKSVQNRFLKILIFNYTCLFTLKISHIPVESVSNHLNTNAI